MDWIRGNIVVFEGTDEIETFSLKSEINWRCVTFLFDVIGTEKVVHSVCVHLRYFKEIRLFFQRVRGLFKIARNYYT